MIEHFSTKSAPCRGQYFPHQHVGGLNTDADHAGQQQHHGMRTFLGSLFQNVEPRLLNLTDLLLHDPVALQIALERGQCVWRDWLTLGRA